MTIYDSKLKKVTSTYFTGGTDEEQFAREFAVKKGAYYICFEAGEAATVYEYSFTLLTGS